MYWLLMPASRTMDQPSSETTNRIHRQYAGSDSANVLMARPSSVRSPTIFKERCNRRCPWQSLANCNYIPYEKNNTITCTTIILRPLDPREDCIANKITNDTTSRYPQQVSELRVQHHGEHQNSSCNGAESRVTSPKTLGFLVQLFRSKTSRRSCPTVAW